MRIFAACILLLHSSLAFTQQSEDLIPQQAVSVFSVNNVNLLQKISLDELVKYEFMEEVQQELFDGSTSGKTLKDSGIDFDQKLNIFFGRGELFELSGFSFGVSDRSELFTVFDDFHPGKSAFEGVDFYESYFNRIAIKGNTGILFRVTPTMKTVDAITDSIWYSRGNESPWYWDELEAPAEEYEFEEEAFGLELEEEMEAIPEVVEDELPEDEEALEVVEENAPDSKTYYELRDSVELALQEQYLRQVCEELFVQGENLMNTQARFAKQVAHDSEGTFYFDNSRALKVNREYLTLKTIYPGFYRNLEELYQDNTMVGDLVINDHSIELKLDASYGDKLGSIYQQMTDAKFDKNVLKYIHKDNSAFFTYRINMREAYEQVYDVVHPMLESEADKDKSFSASLLLLELWDEFINKDAVFETYKGSMFGTYNGIQKVKTTKFVFEYDEETFEYTESEVEAEEDMPLFTLGFSTNRGDIPEKILKFIARVESECHREGDYWVFERALLNSAPMYVLVKNGLFILTNEAQLVKDHPDGYGKNAIEKSLAKAAKKSGFLYGYADLGKAIEGVPREIFNDEENEIIDVIRGKSGKIQLTSSKTSALNTSFNLAYDFEGEYDNAGTYILDLINSLYVISK